MFYYSCTRTSAGSTECQEEQRLGWTLANAPGSFQRMEWLAA